ncbi:hypothetical protein PR048_014769 [Dryococelus australis]|uniref:Uncharacterized protein n=1 Tax=Dryococelus australis TaxID=614101 RepID=A0ABQ9HF27_9NEOP|nr:hypothetical protein PR048_014769 [Dryococelus australis]
MEQRRNASAGETGDPRENPQISGNARHDSHMRKSGDSAPRVDPTSPSVSAARNWNGLGQNIRDEGSYHLFKKRLVQSLLSRRRDPAVLPECRVIVNPGQLTGHVHLDLDGAGVGYAAVAQPLSHDQSADHLCREVLAEVEAAPDPAAPHCLRRRLPAVVELLLTPSTAVTFHLFPVGEEAAAEVLEAAVGRRKLARAPRVCGPSVVVDDGEPQASWIVAEPHEHARHGQHAQSEDEHQKASSTGTTKYDEVDRIHCFASVKNAMTKHIDFYRTKKLTWFRSSSIPRLVAACHAKKSFSSTQETPCFKCLRHRAYTRPLHHFSTFSTKKTSET